MDAPRWHFRFDNFLSTLALLQEAIELSKQQKLSELEKAGLIQRFEICWELGWKTLRDYLSDTGKQLDIPSAINVIRAAFEINLIDDGDAWVEAMRARNQMAHEYNCDAFEKTIRDIDTKYYPLLTSVYAKLEAERAAGN
jgi:nucleotidyltransferase substrate binding protein (TIGR01987 family)